MIRVYPLPELVDPAKLADTTAVVIDVLRASTTIVHALAAGARSVVPSLDVEGARRLAASAKHAGTILGGERQGLPIDGFDLGNSPAEYSPQTVADRTVVFTTTNGTRALDRVRGARRVVIAAFANAAAVVQELRDAPQIALVCAGTRGEITREDVLCAGLLVDRLSANGDGCEIDDAAHIARAAWRAAERSERTLAEELADSLGGRNLEAIGLADDIRLAARLDVFDFVPGLDAEQWQITKP